MEVINTEIWSGENKLTVYANGKVDTIYKFVQHEDKKTQCDFCDLSGICDRKKIDYACIDVAREDGKNGYWKKDKIITMAMIGAEQSSTGQTENKQNKDIIKEETTYDRVKNPAHYCTGKIETINVIADTLTNEEMKGFCKGNIIKYVIRSEKKGDEKTDLQKAKWYLEKLIETIDK